MAVLNITLTNSDLRSLLRNKFGVCEILLNLQKNKEMPNEIINQII